MKPITVIFTLITIITCLALPAEAKRNRIKLLITKNDVNLKTRTLTFKLNRPADSAEIKVYSIEGDLLVQRTEIYKGAKAGTRLSITWPSLLRSEENFRIELKVTSVDDYWVDWEITRFYLEIPHKEVVFETGKWHIRPSESPKLDAALTLLVNAIKKYGKSNEYKVYIAGHTDTVGSLAANRELSRRRAGAIARYFINHGLKKIPLLTRGFGEESLAVETGDNVPEERNRRAQYIIATFPPEVAGPGSWLPIR